MKIKNDWKEIRKAKKKPMSPLKVWLLGSLAGSVATLIILTIIGLLIK